MTTAPAPATTETARHYRAEDDNLTHWTECHDDDRALSGADLADAEWGEGDDTDCVVCLDLDEWHCGCECGCCDEDDA